MCVVDSGPLHAVVDMDNQDHEACLVALTARDRPLVVPALVVAEVTYLVGTRMSPLAEAAFWEALASYDVEPPVPERARAVPNRCALTETSHWDGRMPRGWCWPNVWARRAS